MTSKDEIIEKIKSSSYNSCAIISHTSADPDAIAAAIGMEFLIKSFQPQISIDILIDGISEPTKELMNYYEIITTTKARAKYDLIVIVDVNVLNQMGIYRDVISVHEKEQIMIIDHHTPSDFSFKEVSISYIEDERTSVSEMIAEMIFDLGLKPDTRILTILLTGILYDSRRFYQLNQKLISVITSLFEFGVDYNRAIKLLQKEYDNSERIARLKCASRIKLYKIHGWIVAWSNIGSHEGSAARGILDLGADVALIFSTRKKETRLSVRATSNFYEKTDIHFGKDIMSILSEHYLGEGGGHSTAAALNISQEIDQKELKSFTLKLLEKQIKNKIEK